jgi:hypothetical protein
MPKRSIKSVLRRADVTGISSNLRIRAHFAAVALALGSALLAGCETPPPEPPPPPVYVLQSTFDRAWNAALGGVQDAGVKLASADRAIGLIRGSKDGLDVTVSVVRQADGSVRVQFDARGPRERDPGLADRFSQAYDRRMGR